MEKGNLEFGALQWFYWSSILCFQGFLVPFLIENGYTNIQIGIISSFISLMTVIAQPMWGFLCDRFETVKKILVPAMLVSGIIVAALPSFRNNFWLVLTISSVYSLTANSMPTIIDTWTLKSAVYKPTILYGPTRAAGSAGYAILALFCGRLFDIFGLNYSFYAYGFFTVVTTFIATSMDDSCMRQGPSLKRSSVSVTTMVKSVVANYEYRAFLLFGTVFAIGMRGTLTFFPVLLKHVGGTNSDLGWAILVMAGSEIPPLILSTQLLKRFKPQTLLIASMFFYALRIGLHIPLHSTTGLILIQVTQAFSFGLYLPAMLYFVDSVAPPHLKTAYQTLAVAFNSGIGSIVGNYIGGIIVDSRGIYAYYCFATLAVLLGAIGFSLFLGMKRTSS
ncbi:MAG TPA: MFS transporter [Spirochaetia bacterium]|nr:MFS transporter [Spirochaetia bacterium]